MNNEMLAVLREKYHPDNQQLAYEMRGYPPEKRQALREIDEIMYALPDEQFLEQAQAYERASKS